MEVVDKMPEYSVPEHQKTPLSLCKLLFNKLPMPYENMDVLDPFSSESEMSIAIRILNNENGIWVAGNSKCEWDGVKIDEHNIDWVVGTPSKEVGYKTAVEYFCGRTDKGVALLTDSISDLDPKFLDKIYKKKGVYMWKIVVCSLQGKTHYFTILKNRCCRACNNKVEGCCPEVKGIKDQPVGAWRAFVENKEHMPHHHHTSSNKPRFDFFDYIEGSF